MTKAWYMIFCLDSDVELNTFIDAFDVGDEINLPTLEDIADKVVGPIKMDLDDIIDDVSEFLEDVVEGSYPYFIFWKLEPTFITKKFGIFDVDENK